MLTTFSVENFRLFRHIEIAHLGRVNLLVGKNNSGKSAFLEAVTVYASNASLRTLQDLIGDREETWNERNQPAIQRTGDNAIRHLFRGHKIPDFDSPGIVIGPIGDKSKQLHLLTRAFETVTEEDGTSRRRMLNAAEAADSQGEQEFEIALVAQEGDKSRRIVRVDQPGEYLRPSALLSAPEPNYPFQVVPTHNMIPTKIAALWDMIGLTPMAAEVINGLKLIEPSITGILFVQNTRDSRMPLASSSNASEPLPLKSMGDGITRLFHIIVALVSARNGILLIDEFENGLHWSVQLAVWKTVFRLAEHLNVQVFATTHSRDCVAGFEGAWMEHRDTGAFFRLQLDAAGIPAVKAYSLETLADSLDTDVEVR